MAAPNGTTPILNAFSSLRPQRVCHYLQTASDERDHKPSRFVQRNSPNRASHSNFEIYVSLRVQVPSGMFVMAQAVLVSRTRWINSKNYQSTQNGSSFTNWSFPWCYSRPSHPSEWAWIRYWRKSFLSHWDFLAPFHVRSTCKQSPKIYNETWKALTFLGKH